MDEFIMGAIGGAALGIVLILLILLCRHLGDRYDR